MILDDALTRRIEGAVAEERRRFAEGMAACHPDTRADWAPVAGGVAVFTGRGFFANRAFGLGSSEPVTAAHLEEVEGFYLARGAAPAVEIPSTAERGCIDLLTARGYRMVRFHNLYAQSLVEGSQGGPHRDDGIEVEPVGDARATDAWGDVLLDGFGYK
ncbi:MAG: hypothetical protein GWO02_06010, partial [Gammaproteobacteria bacterium]|nr:hypothetical protein [Gammaproteobacteria bacterium]